MSDGEAISFKKKIEQPISFNRQRKLSPDVREVPVPIQNNISNNTIRNSIPNNTVPKSIPNNADTSPIVEELKQTNYILEDIRKGTYNRSVQHLDVYKRTNTIPVATATQPTFDTITDGTTTGYTREAIFEALHRNATRVVVRNLGPGDLYVIYSSTGTNEFTTNESYILEGDSEAFLNCYEVRLRSPTANLQYDITETEIPIATTTITRAEKIETYNTISTTDFTAACAINAMITLNLNPPLLSNKYTIRGVNIQSIQQIDFDLLFFGSNVFATAGVLDTDTFLDSVELDMTAFPAFRINSANQWRLSVSNLNILYEDINQSNTLHVALLNLGPVAKIANALGGVQIDFKMTPRA